MSLPLVQIPPQSTVELDETFSPALHARLQGLSGFEGLVRGRDGRTRALFSGDAASVDRAELRRRVRVKEER